MLIARCQFGGEPYSLGEFNSAAQGLQRAAGVNPADCMQIVECPTVDQFGFTPLDLFLGHLAQKKFATPPRIVSGHRAHDELLHFRAVASTHPNSATLYAEVAAKAIASANRDIVETIADHLDGTLGTGVYYLFNCMNGNSPKPHETVRWRDMVFEPAQWQKYVEVENAHRKVFWAAADQKIAQYNSDY
jgi:hypothetical protein